MLSQAILAICHGTYAAAKRSALSPNNMNKLITIHSNGHLVEELHNAQTLA